MIFQSQILLCVTTTIISNNLVKTWVQNDYCDGSFLSNSIFLPPHSIARVLSSHLAHTLTRRYCLDSRQCKPHRTNDPPDSAARAPRGSPEILSQQLSQKVLLFMIWSSFYKMFRTDTKHITSFISSRWAIQPRMGTSVSPTPGQWTPPLVGEAGHIMALTPGQEAWHLLHPHPRW